MKVYNKAEMRIVSVSNNDIVTASNIGIGNTTVTNSNQIQTPGRRSIWD